MHVLEIGGVLADLKHFEGTEIFVRGQLLVDGNRRSFLCQSFDPVEAFDRLPVCDDGILADQLLGKIPPYGGGPFIYYEEAWLTGRIQNGLLNRLKAWRVVRDEYEIIQLQIET